MYDRKDDVKARALELRKQHGALSWDASPLDVIRDEGLDYGEYDFTTEGILQRIGAKVSGALRKIRAILSVPEKAVLIDANSPTVKKPFGQAHELGHHTIDWHREILYVCNEWDLSFDTRKEMEFGANQFAGEFLVPTPLLHQIYSEYPLSVETVLHMSQLSSASIHACFVKFVADCPKPCCLLTLDKEADPEGNLQLQMRRKPLYSPAWYRGRTPFVAHDQILSTNHIVTEFVDDPPALDPRWQAQYQYVIRPLSTKRSSRDG